MEFSECRALIFLFFSLLWWYTDVGFIFYTSS